MNIYKLDRLEVKGVVTNAVFVLLKGSQLVVEDKFAERWARLSLQLKYADIITNNVTTRIFTLEVRLVMLIFGPDNHLVALKNGLIRVRYY